MRPMKALRSTELPDRDVVRCRDLLIGSVRIDKVGDEVCVGEVRTLEVGPEEIRVGNGCVDETRVG